MNSGSYIKFPVHFVINTIWKKLDSAMLCF